jgi:hypothetical protein
MKKLIILVAISIVCFAGCARRHVYICGMRGNIQTSELHAGSATTPDNKDYFPIKVKSTFVDTIPIRRLP